MGSPIMRLWLPLRMSRLMADGGNDMWARMLSAAFAVLAVAVTPLAAAATPAATAGDAMRIVRPGESIQAALDAVAPGGTVVVQAGEYRENLEIVKDGVTLQGHGAVLRPPSLTQPRRCSVAIGLVDNLLGICVAGELEPGGTEPVVRRPVAGVTVRGMTVEDFPLTGLVVFGGQGIRIEDNALAGGHAYGLLASVSTGTVVSGNRVNGGDSAGIYIGASPQSQTRVFGNRVTGAGLFGIYIRNASHGTVAGNIVEAACMGMGFIATASARDTISDWLATGNLVRRNNRLCSAGGGATLTGTGILLGGVDRITVAYNVVHDNAVPSGTDAPWGGGIVLVNGRLFGGPAESVDTQITGNLLYGNQPFDINMSGPSTRTQTAHNICTSSSPAGICR